MATSSCSNVSWRKTDGRTMGRRCRRHLRVARHGARDLVHRGAAEVPGPGVTLQLGLGIGRLVFRALNTAELVLGAAVLVALALQPPPLPVVVTVLVAVVALAVQLLAVRPRLSRRSDAVLAGEDGVRSRAHYVYVGLEVIKVIALLVSGILLLAA